MPPLPLLLRQISSMDGGVVNKENSRHCHMHVLACTHTHTHTVSHACTALGAFPPSSLHTQHTHARTNGEHGTLQPRTSPRNGHPSFLFFLLPPSCYLRCREGKREQKLLKIPSQGGVGATAEVKQSESCRQSFNLKRTRSLWGARGAGHIKKFNNSMFYGPRK